MIVRIRHLTQVVGGIVLLMLTGSTRALAGPADPGGAPPIEPEFQPPGGSSAVDTGSGFPWLYTGAGVLLVIAMATLVAVLWYRSRPGHERLVTP